MWQGIFGSFCQYSSSKNNVTMTVDIVIPDYYQILVTYCSNPNRAKEAKFTFHRDQLPGKAFRGLFAPSSPASHVLSGAADVGQA